MDNLGQSPPMENRGQSPPLVISLIDRLGLLLYMLTLQAHMIQEQSLTH
ncbi:unnamed protein product [Arabidopsis lyrata]|nr:unnamed protein product [Arabidopsis lyrata]